MPHLLQQSSRSRWTRLLAGRISRLSNSPQALLSLPASVFLGQAKLEDVFKNAQESMSQGPGSGRMIALGLGATAISLLLVVLQQRRKQSAIPKSVNHQGRLLKEVLPSLPLKKAELKQLKELAEEQSCSSPLLLMLCPSLLTKAIQAHAPDERGEMDKLLRKITASQPDGNE